MNLLLFKIKNKHGNMPFNLRHFEEETKARMGVVECVSHKMIEPFQVLYEKPSKFYCLSINIFSYFIFCSLNQQLLLNFSILCII